ncbi:thioredoxin H1-like [Silene latifolia]|uniref:thioredoxin H1-like n=1 Tax=Silene latifolia TaxID=37657 RepID=UPI003D781213
MAEEGQVIVCGSQEEVTLNLDKGQKEHKLVMIFFTASWCGPCRFVAPGVAELANMYPNVRFLKVDVDDLPDVARAWNVRAMPTFTFLKNGEKVDEVVGATKVALEDAIEKYSEGLGGTTSTSAI